MFFDIVLLNPQHRGHFSQAWIAATRGVRFITKEQTRELSIPALCKQLTNFIVTNSTDPKKRFSLRLSALLLNGTIKIFRKKVILLEAEVISALHTIRHPSGVRSVPYYPLEGFLETPPTPLIKVKKSRRTKKQNVATPIMTTTRGGEPVAGTLLIADVADVLQVQPTTADMITLREEAPRQAIALIPEEDDFGTITGEELEDVMRSFFPRAATKPVVAPITPETPSSELPPSQKVEVVALFHAEKGEFFGSARIPPENVDPKILPEVPIPMEVEQIQTIPDVPEPEHRLYPSAPEGGALPVAAPKDIETDEPVLREITSGEVLSKVERVKKDKPASAKLFLSSRKRRIVRINRCVEGGGSYLDETFPVPIAVKSFCNDDLFNLYWPDEDEAVREDVRLQGSSSRGISLSLRGTSTSKKSSLEKDSTGAAASLTEIPLKETLSVSGIDVLPFPQEDTGRLEAGQISEPFITQEPSIPPIAPVVLEQLHEEPIAPGTRELSSEISLAVPLQKTTKRKIPCSPEEDVDPKRRQQKIVDRLLKWNFDETLPTIEDLSEKPMTKLNMARAFSDLLVLSKEKFVTLRSKEASTELECILKGPRLQKL